MKTIPVRVRSDLNDRLKAVAARSGVTKATLLNAGIEHLLDDIGNDSIHLSLSTKRDTGDGSRKHD